MSKRQTLEERAAAHSRAMETAGKTREFARLGYTLAIAAIEIRDAIRESRPVPPPCLGKVGGHNFKLIIGHGEHAYSVCAACGLVK